MQPLRENKERPPKTRKDKRVLLTYTVGLRSKANTKSPFKEIVCKERYATRRDAEQAIEGFLIGRGMWNRSIWEVKDYKIQS